MFDPSSFVNLTPLAHADTLRDVLPRRGTSQISLSPINALKRRSSLSGIVPSPLIKSSIFITSVVLSIMLLTLIRTSIWILADSRSCFQYLKNWPKIMNSTGLDILSKLVRLGQRKQVCLQWIPSHVGVPGNEAADELAGVKSFFTCPCSLLASPAHLMDCWGISLRQLYEEQDLVCETITRNGQMDLV
ncbi:RNase H domain-containing protein [Trichonephila clavipes]|nr:RNase H domain-containing protein [Trichonephila clavipes]